MILVQRGDLIVAWLSKLYNPMKEAMKHERESVRRFLEHKNPSPSSSSSHFVVEV
jgi:hypothetical protein